MDNKVEENYKRLREELNERLNSDNRLTDILDKISKGTATFKDSARYSQIVADHMGDVISKNIGKITVPLGKEMVCKKLLKDNIERVDTVFGKVQVSVDEKMGIHLNPVTPPYPTERVNAIAHSLEDPNADDEKVARRGRSSGNVVAARHDENVKANAAWREKAGFDCYLVRDAGGGCCAWCQALAGRYKYAEAPDDVFRRHDNCTCTVTYECGKMRQDVWSKESNWSKEQSQEYMRQHDAALAEKRKELRAKGVNVSNAKLNKEEIEAIKARIDASEAAKPTVNTPEQAKEIERQALEKNPVTKLTPEQAKAIDEQSKPTVNTPEQAQELENRILGKAIDNNVIDYMSKSFRPQYSNTTSVFDIEDISISTKKVENSDFEIYADVNETQRSKAVRLAEKNLKAIQDTLPDGFEIPPTVVVDFEKHGLNPDAIGGYHSQSGVMYINSKYDTSEKVLEFLNHREGEFANTTEISPILHELGHKYYEDCVKSLAKAENIEYNKAKDIIDNRIQGFIHDSIPNGLSKTISGYADAGYKKHKYTEIIAECFTVRDTNDTAGELISLLKGVDN